jgi:Restriction endonuclease
MRGLPFDQLDATAFEEFCFELLGELGFVNVDWRKGTDLPASPADHGRDLVAQLPRTDIDGAVHYETWFVDCKHYKRGVPPKELQTLLAWASAERPHVALFIASGFLSNPSKDFLKEYEQNNRPPFRIKYWERPTLERVTAERDEFLRRFLFDLPRNENEILAAEQEFFDRVWYVRHLIWAEQVARGEARPSDELWEKATSAAQAIRDRYDEESLVVNDFEWGMVNGKLSALRWVLGDEWDFLDT